MSSLCVRWLQRSLCLPAAVLVWLNYKNAYEYWNEQRLALNKEVQTATQQVIDKLPLGNISQQAAPIIGTLFLQLTVDDLGICLPMTDISQVGRASGDFRFHVRMEV